jgi:hypothetical protein
VYSEVLDNSVLYAQHAAMVLISKHDKKIISKSWLLIQQVYASSRDGRRRRSTNNLLESDEESPSCVF